MLSLVGRWAREALNVAMTIHCAEAKAPSLRVTTEEFAFKPRIDVSNALVKAVLGSVFFPSLVAFFYANTATASGPS